MLLLNGGDGVLTPGGGLPEGLWAGSWHAAALDADRDGDDDVYLVRAASNQADLLLLNDGAGSFAQAPAEMFAEPRDSLSRHARVADLDRDGDPDVVVAGDGIGLRVWWNREVP